EELHVLSGDDGRVLFTVQLSPPGSGHFPASVVVLDVDGDGHSEILGANGLFAYLLGRHGNLLWQTPVCCGFFSLCDPDLDGNPEVVFPSAGGITVLDARSGTLVGTSQANFRGFRGYEFGVPSAGAVRQDGLAYPALGDNSSEAKTMALTPDLQPLWLQSL